MNIDKLKLSHDEKSILEGFIAPYNHLGGISLLRNPEGEISRLDESGKVPELLIALNEEKKFHHIHILTYTDENEVPFLLDLVSYDEDVQEFLDGFKRLRMKANAWEKEYMVYDKIVQEIKKNLHERVKEYINENVLEIEEKFDMPRPVAKLTFYRRLKDKLEEELSLSQMKTLSSGQFLELF